MITMMIGHNAIRKPSRDAVIQLINDSFHTVIARTIDTSREPNAALYVGHFSTINAKISQRIGLNPSMKCRNSIHNPLKPKALYNEYVTTGTTFWGCIKKKLIDSGYNLTGILKKHEKWARWSPVPKKKKKK